MVCKIQVKRETSFIQNLYLTGNTHSNSIKTCLQFLRKVNA